MMSWQVLGFAPCAPGEHQAEELDSGVVGVLEVVAGPFWTEDRAALEAEGLRLGDPARVWEVRER
jgi:hypothetical protein